MNATRNCKVCGERFEGRINSKYCSNACRVVGAARRNERYNREVRGCRPVAESWIERRREGLKN